MKSLITFSCVKFDSIVLHSIKLVMTEVVRGEASESDDEQFRGPKVTNVFASQVTGEASESDEDVYEKSIRPADEKGHNTAALFNNNLLQRKLIENNVKIWNSLNSYVKSFVISPSKELLATDQLLIKSQVSMQSILSSLKLAQNNMKQLSDKTNSAFTMNFIPNINIPKQK